MSPGKAAVRFVAGLTVAGTILLLMEGAARLLPLDRWERNRQSASHPLFLPGEGDSAGYYVTNPHFRNAMSFQRFSMTKKAGVKRVFVLGGSAALGWPGPVDSSFSGYMQRALDEVLPGRYEIINCAAMSYGSHRVRDILADVLDKEPDVVVIWSGNNEYIERNAITPFARTSASRGLQRVLRHSGLYRSLRLALAVAAPRLFARPAGVDITDPRVVPLVRRGMLGRSEASDRNVLVNFQANLRSMAGTIGAAGAGGILCTVPVNLSGWMPIDVPPAVPGSGSSADWRGTWDAAFRAWEQKRYEDAARGLRLILESTPRYAIAHYLLGDALRKTGRTGEARRFLAAARDLDPRPIRALGSFRDVILGAAAERQLEVADLERAFEEASGGNPPGNDLFIDYVHPNEAGHKLAARTVLAAMRRRFDPALPLEALARAIDGDDWARTVAYNRADSHYARGMTLFNNGDLEGAEQAFLLALEEAPGYPEPAGNLGFIYEQRGDLETARDYYLRAVHADPGSTFNGHLARVLHRLGDRDGAREAGERLLRQGVVEVGLLVLLGDIAVEEDRLPRAIELYLQAAEAGDRTPELQTRIGDTYQRMGDDTNAKAAYARAAALR